MRACGCCDDITPEPRPLSFSTARGEGLMRRRVRHETCGRTWWQHEMREAGDDDADR